MGALSLTVDDASLRKNYSPFLPGIVPIPYANCYRCPFGQENQNCSLLCVNYIKHLLDTVVKPEEVAAIFVEPIQNHGGVIIPPIEYFRELRKICSKHDILLVDDEVVMAFGRTGKMFGIEHFGVEPDIMYFGKPFGVGLPLGAILARGDLMEDWHGGASTLAGALLPCVRALTMIDIIRRERLTDNARKTGEHILKRIHEIAEINPLIGDVRGKGLMIGIELVKDHKTKDPATEEAKRVVDSAYKRGLLIGASGPFKNVLKLTPPIILTKEQADAGLDMLHFSLRDA
jgi:4-aminobutyrate aminotransferase-like enzyme